MLAVIAVAGGGFVVCGAMGWPFHGGPVAVAAAATLVASAAAFVPMVLARGSSQSATAQASLVGTLIHLFGCLVGAATLLLVLRTGTCGAYWMLAFYWATLVVVVIELSRAVRRAPPASAPPPAA
jgi:hypothetical protein